MPGSASSIRWIHGGPRCSPAVPPHQRPPPQGRAPLAPAAAVAEKDVIALPRLSDEAAQKAAAAALAQCKKDGYGFVSVSVKSGEASIAGIGVGGAPSRDADAVCAAAGAAAIVG